MNLLSGKVEIRSLEVTQQPAARKDVQARLMTAGGELAVLADGKSPIRHLSYVELCAGRVRGNHFHKLRHETFYLIAGELELHLQDVQSGERAVVPMKAGDLARIAPEVAHAFLPRTDGHGIEFATEIFDSGDVYRRAIIEVGS
jgi:oxalate decarboxylase/phosphoglucose isomerase-like protein (cupin superfamily)